MRIGDIGLGFSLGPKVMGVRVWGVGGQQVSQFLGIGVAGLEPRVFG